MYSLPIYTFKNYHKKSTHNYFSCNAYKLHISWLLYLLLCIYNNYHIEPQKEKDMHIKQGLRDIRKVIQLEYKRKYGYSMDDFSELKRFLLDDSVYSISTSGIK